MQLYKVGLNHLCYGILGYNSAFDYSQSNKQSRFRTFPTPPEPRQPNTMDSLDQNNHISFLK